jgi:hypothetical protein
MHYSHLFQDQWWTSILNIILTLSMRRVGLKDNTLLETSLLILRILMIHGSQRDMLTLDLLESSLPILHQGKLLFKSMMPVKTLAPSSLGGMVATSNLSSSFPQQLHLAPWSLSLRPQSVSSTLIEKPWLSLLELIWKTFNLTQPQSNLNSLFLKKS